MKKRKDDIIEMLKDTVFILYYQNTEINVRETLVDEYRSLEAYKLQQKLRRIKLHDLQYI